MVSIDFASGFIAGEGTFTVQTNASRNRIHPQFSVMIHEKDKKTLEALRDKFDGIGSIYDRTSVDDCYHWRVSSQDDLLTLIEELDEADGWKVTEKYDQYQTWKEVVKLYTEEYHTAQETKIEMAKLCRDELNVGMGKSEESWNEFIDTLH